jgi:hypothetical protein
VQIVSNIRQREVNTAEPVVPGTGRPEVETALVKLEKYRSPDDDQILAELQEAYYCTNLKRGIKITVNIFV